MSITNEAAAYVFNHPNASVSELMKKFRISTATAYKARKIARKQIALSQAITVATAAHKEVVDRSWDETPRAKDRQVGGDHYKNMAVEPWDVVDTWPREQRIGYYRGGALKYIMRMGSKDVSAQEIAKAQHYIQKLLEVLNERDD